MSSHLLGALSRLPQDNDFQVLGLFFTGVSIWDVHPGPPWGWVTISIRETLQQDYYPII